MNFNPFNSVYRGHDSQISVLARCVSVKKHVLSVELGCHSTLNQLCIVLYHSNIHITDLEGVEVIRLLGILAAVALCCVVGSDVLPSNPDFRYRRSRRARLATF